MATKSKTVLKIRRSDSIQPIEEVDIGDHTASCLRVYGEEVNLDRAVADIRDGLKPVTRRLLWALYTMRSDKTVKTARLSGETIGKYHPHGSASAEGAITTQVVTDTPPITGVGNWGSLIDPPGAPRYTNVAMSSYGETFFMRHYLPLAPMVDNYDGKNKEPLFLPAVLPNILMNGTEGIGLGMSTAYPSFTPKSLLPVLADMVDGKDLTNEQIVRRLVLHHKYGGTLIPSKENFNALLGLMEKPKASLKWTSPIIVNEQAKEIIIEAFAPGVNPIKLVEEWLKPAAEVASVNSGRGVSYTVRCRRDLNMNEFNNFVNKLRAKVSTSHSYELYVTKRVLNPDNPTKYDVKFATMSLRSVMESWLGYRVSLEKASLRYRIDQSRKSIAYYGLLILACSKLDVVFKALRSSDPKSKLMEGLDIDSDQAETILNLKVRQLSKLDNDKIEAQRAEERKILADLKTRLKNPSGEVSTFLRESAEKFKLVKNDWSLQWQM